MIWNSSWSCNRNNNENTVVWQMKLSMIALLSEKHNRKI